MSGGLRQTRDIPTVRAWIDAYRADRCRIGFVPTMGALHEGHLSLVDRARDLCDRVVLSIFVNPTQFGPGEDFERYPRALETDAERARARGVDILFAPGTAVLYPEGEPLTGVEMRGLTDTLCGAKRPGHFRGVMTVVTKLFNIVRPDVAIFGRKDIQQLIVIERMARDLDIPVEIVAAPTVREPDGLAMSSRNRLLSPEDRAEAPRIYGALRAARERIEAGERQSAGIVREMESHLRCDRIRTDYLSVVCYEDLREIDRLDRKNVVAVAVFLGDTRLIDNMIVEIPDDRPVFSL